MPADLQTKYLGLNLKNPVVASAGPLTGRQETLRELEQAGVAGVVMPSLFEEQFSVDRQRVQLGDARSVKSPVKSLSYFPRSRDYENAPRACLTLLEQVAGRMSIPIIASLNGASPSGWVHYARLLENHGASAIELNVYYVATDPLQSAIDVEQRYLDLVAAVRGAVKIPMAVKLGQQFTNLANFVPRLASAGADGVVLFNRFLEPDIDLETLRISPQLDLSSHHELRAALRWIAILRDQVDVSLGATGGIHFPEDVVKLLLVGADVCLVTSTLLRHGCAYAQELLRALGAWLDAHGYESVEQLKGRLSYGNSPDAGNLERANYMKAIFAYTSTC